MYTIYAMSDYTINSTDNNEYSGGERDENLWEESLMDVDIPTDDSLSIQEDPRPEYDEQGYRENIGE